jgi:hypothetical protein
MLVISNTSAKLYLTADASCQILNPNSGVHLRVKLNGVGETEMLLGERRAISAKFKGAASRITNTQH